MSPLDEFLNAALRPGKFPHLAYSTVPRFTTMLICDYQLDVKWTPGAVCVTINCPEFCFQKWAKFHNEKERRSSLGYAVASVVVDALRMVALEQEKKNAESTSNV